MLAIIEQRHLTKENCNAITNNFKKNVPHRIELTLTLYFYFTLILLRIAYRKLSRMKSKILRYVQLVFQWICNTHESTLFKQDYFCEDLKMTSRILYTICLSLLLMCTINGMTLEEKDQLRLQVIDMFKHGYNSYMVRHDFFFTKEHVRISFLEACISSGWVDVIKVIKWNAA